MPKDRLVEVPLWQIETKDRARKEFKDLESLASSIQEHGLAHPPLVRKIAEDKYQLIAGERRLKAHMILERKTVPVIVREDVADLKAKELELEENIQRQNLTWPEQVELMRQIDEVKTEIHGRAQAGDPSTSEGWSVEKQAELTGQSKSNAARQIALGKKLKERPDLLDKVKHLPATAAIKEIEKIERREKLNVDELTEKQEDNCKVLQGSCLDLIKRVPDNSVHLVLTDPPFGIDEIENQRGKQSDKNIYVNKLSDFDNLSAEAADELAIGMIPELYRVLQPGCYLYLFFASSHYEILTLALQSAGFETATKPLIWDKQVTGRYTGYNYASRYEPILFAWKPPRDRRLNNSLPDVLAYNVPKRALKFHAFEKPIDLLQALIENSSERGEVVLDFCCGSGSTLVAAQACGRKSIGFEINPDHVAYALSRTSQTQTSDKEPTDGNTVAS